MALGTLAHLAVVRGPTLIESENGYLNNVVYVDVQAATWAASVAEAKELLGARLALPPGYRLEWSGQYEAMQRANRTLRVVVPVTIGIILLLLYLNFGSVAESAIVMLSLPFALVGGMWLMWPPHYNLSVAVAIGFIALAGVAAETGVIMLVQLDQPWRSRWASGRVPERGDLAQAVTEGAMLRVRPLIMTVTAVIGGLPPISGAKDRGGCHETHRRPDGGGMMSGTLLTWWVPAIYSLWRERELARRLRLAGTERLCQTPAEPLSEPVPAEVDI